MDRGAWWTIVHGVARSQTGLSDQHFRFPFFFNKPLMRACGHLAGDFSIVVQGFKSQTSVHRILHQSTRSVSSPPSPRSRQEKKETSKKGGEGENGA